MTGKSVPNDLSVVHTRIVRGSLVVLTLASFSWWQSTPAEVMRGNYAVESIFVRVIPMLSIFVLLLGVDRRTDFPACRELLRNRLLLALTLYAAVSFFAGVLFSRSLASGWKGVELLILGYFGSHVSIVTKGVRSDSRLLEAFFAAIVVLLLWTTLSALVNPAVGFRPLPIPQIQGIKPVINPNGVAFLAGMTLLYALTIRSWALKATLLVSCSLVFLSAQSRTALVAILALVAVQLARICIGLIKPRGQADHPREVLAIGSLCFLLAVAIGLHSLYLPAVLSYFQRGADVEEMRSFSGRLHLWEKSIERWRDSPIFGFGIGAASRTLTLDDPSFRGVFREGGVGSVHNSALEALLGAGLLGSGLYILLLYLLCTRAAVNAVLGDNDVTMFSLPALPNVLTIMLLFRSVTGATLAVFTVDTLLLVILYSGRMYPWQRNRIREAYLNP